ncbi:MAG: SNF2 helicase associated domain-containing protein [Clostridia bacterium]|nr:SNF2 helicase associated domain-containing protein [Clostridia bacterium]
MLINASEINSILSEAGTEVTNRGKKYFEQNRVKVADFNFVSENNYVAKAYVEGTYIYETEIRKTNGVLSYKCECPSSSKKDTPCKHVVAMIFDMYINESSYINYVKKSESADIDDDVVENKSYKDKINEQRENNGLMIYYENLELNRNIDKESVRIEANLHLVNDMKKELEVSFKMGKDRMYILRDVYKFSEDIQKGAINKYGKELEFMHAIESFEKSSQPLAKLIVSKALEYNEFSKLGTYHFTLNKRFKTNFKLKYSVLDELFDILKGQKLTIEDYDYEKAYGVVMLEESDPSFDIEIVDAEEKGLYVISNSDKYYVFEGQDYSYVLYKEKLHRCSNDFKTKVLPLLEKLSEDPEGRITISKNSATSFCEYVIPALKDSTNMAIGEGILEKYRAEKLGTKIFLDIDGKGNIVAEVKFCYGEDEFNPFDKDLEITCNRNIIEEARAKELFKMYNFVINFKKHIIYLSNEDDIYTFLTEGIDKFMEKFEVLVTDKLKNRQIISQKTFNMGVRIENNFLEIDFNELGLDENELKDIFKRYKLRKKYYRLKNGSFINIDSEGIGTLVNLAKTLNITEKDIVAGSVEIPKYRALYIDNLAKNTNSDVAINLDNDFKEIVKSIKDIEDVKFEEPEELKGVLRSYQKTGFNWLKTLEKYGFGGILADDMGLGKTIQIIALLLDEKNRTGKTSIVVCPSSLYINWEKEIKRFSSNIKTLIVSGNAEQRENLIGTIEDYDVVITSYDLLKRDIEKYENFKFKYVIADEAQYIKNNNTKNAKALKDLKSEVRFALTGTPIENSLAELWSIFDFIMPGYLYTYKKFKDEFETLIIKENDNLVMEKLQRLVAPFVLRRIKKDVLKELPDKTEQIMYSKMDEEQQKLYNSYLALAKVKMRQEIESNGFEKSKFKILSLITRLRQICCHPQLFLEDYSGESSKLNQCLEIIEGAIAAKHKILLFSGFTSMFDILTPELEKRGIEYSILTGQTKVDTRIEMVDEFNKDDNIKVFLISLKAGGTGLNLTGADMVIHYDPWWNLSAQNQATDRAYRIGQRNNVQVFKLISENSIEEKIQKLQDKKMDLTESVIKTGETFISHMTKEELLGLFE